MNHPAQHTVLRKIFVNGFYRTHSGMLIFLFVMLISYCLFINTLGVVPADQVDFWQFFFTISMVSNPLIMALYLLGCLVYAYKSWQYISAQFRLPAHQFLYYSANSFKKSDQFKCWVYIQSLIFIPVLLFTLYAVVIGIVFKYYLLSVTIATFLIFLIAISALFYTWLNNHPKHSNPGSWLMILGRTWKKPIFLLYTYQVFHQSKLAYALTKLLCWILISSVFLVFNDLKNDPRFLMLIVSSIALAHVVLIYQERNFNERYLSFLHNFPYGKGKLFTGFLLNYGVLLVPEICWLFSRVHFTTAVLLLAFLISAILLFRCISLLKGLKIKAFLILVFSAFFLFYLVIIFGFAAWLIPLNVILAFLIFNRNYLNKNLLE